MQVFCSSLAEMCAGCAHLSQVLCDAAEAWFVPTSQPLSGPDHLPVPLSIVLEGSAGVDLGCYFWLNPSARAHPFQSKPAV